MFHRLLAFLPAGYKLRSFLAASLSKVFVLDFFGAVPGNIPQGLEGIPLNRFLTPFNYTSFGGSNTFLG